MLSNFQGPGYFHQAAIKIIGYEKVKLWLYNKRKVDIEPTIRQNSIVSKTLLEKF